VTNRERLSFIAERNSAPTVGGLPAWTLALVLTLAAILALAVAFCCLRPLLRRLKSSTSHRRNPSPTHSSSFSPKSSDGKVICHLCLSKVAIKPWSNGAHRRKCARGNAQIIDRMPIPFDVRCIKCSQHLRQWPRRGPRFRCDGGRGCPTGRILAENNGANRFACFLCNYDLCRTCVQRKVRKQELKQRERAGQMAGNVLLNVREPSLRRLRLEYSDVSEDPLVSLNSTVPADDQSTPRILVTAPTNQDLLGDRRFILNSGTASTSVASVNEAAASPTPLLQEVHARSPSPLASHTINIASTIASRSGPVEGRQRREASEEAFLQQHQPNMDREGSPFPTRSSSASPHESSAAGTPSELRFDSSHCSTPCPLATSSPAQPPSYEQVMLEDSLREESFVDV